jgi:hypothetical protein
MVRENLTPESRNLFICTYSPTGADRWVSTVRLEPGGTATLSPGNSYISRQPDFAYPNVWFRLKRLGNTFTAFYGTNGVEWRQLGNQFTPTPSYPATVHLGLATTPNETRPTRAVEARYLNFADWVTPADRELKISSRIGEASPNTHPSTINIP